MYVAKSKLLHDVTYNRWTVRYPEVRLLTQKYVRLTRRSFFCVMPSHKKLVVYVPHTHACIENDSFVHPALRCPV